MKRIPGGKPKAVVDILMEAIKEKGSKAIWWRDGRKSLDVEEDGSLLDQFMLKGILKGFSPMPRDIKKYLLDVCSDENGKTTVFIHKTNQCGEFISEDTYNSLDDNERNDYQRIEKGSRWPSRK